VVPACIPAWVRAVRSGWVSYVRGCVCRRWSRSWFGEAASGYVHAQVHRGHVVGGVLAGVCWCVCACVGGLWLGRGGRPWGVFIFGSASGFGGR
jgi:hypothetical protein